MNRFCSLAISYEKQTVESRRDILSLGEAAGEPLAGDHGEDEKDHA